MKNFSISEKKPRVLTGMQPTAGIQLGNFLGALRNWVHMQADYDCYFFIADLHAITVPQDPKSLSKNTLDCVALYLASGLDGERSKIFLQSQVRGHTDLMWILSCLTSIGQLERMTQFKDKSARQAQFVGAGLLCYPILMAADILLYRVEAVPVGEDQKQHLELARDLAERFNATFGPLFPLPEPIIGRTGGRIMSLQNPGSKMSKSDPNSLGTIFILDEDDLIRKKIRSAVTDSGREITARPDKPGMTNLLEIFSTLSERPASAIEADFEGKTYGDFKKALAEVVVESLRPIRERFHEFRHEEALLRSVLRTGQEQAQAEADECLRLVRQSVGFL